VATTASRHRIVPLADMEKQAILAALNQLNGDKLMTAKLLGIGKTTLYRKLKEYGITDRWGVSASEEAPRSG
jgi:two-component system response regulator HydG